MKTLIVYAGKTGTTEKCALKLEKLLEGETTVINMMKDRLPELDSFENIIIGGSIRIGKVQKQTRNYAKKNCDRLSGKKIGIFLCMGEKENKFEEYLKANFDSDFLKLVSVKGFFGGEFAYDRLPKFLGNQLKKMAVEKGEPHVIEENIVDFAGKFGG